MRVGKLLANPILGIVSQFPIHLVTSHKSICFIPNDVKPLARGRLTEFARLSLPTMNYA
jgi:hypothetical protein